MRNQFLTALILAGLAGVGAPARASAQLLTPAASALAQAPAAQNPAANQAAGSYSATLTLTVTYLP